MKPPEPPLGNPFLLGTDDLHVVLGDEQTFAEAPLPETVAAAHPASSAQEAMWYLDQTLVEPAAYNIAFRGILDGHIILSRKLASKNHFPAVDVLPSISRLFSALAIPEQKQLCAKMRDLMATYNDAEDLIQIGAYTKGSSPNIDQAIQFQPAIQAFLRQAVAEGSDYRSTLLAMGQIFGIDLAPFLKPA